MPDLGKKYTCYSCHTKFYDLNKPVPLCPKCGADQRDAEEAPLVTSARGRRIVEEPVEDPEFGAEAETPAAETEEDDEFAAPGVEEREEDAEDEDEDY